MEMHVKSRLGVISICVLVCLLNVAGLVKAESKVIKNDRIRITAEKVGDTYSLQFESADADGNWHTVLSNTAVKKNAPWQPQEHGVTQNLQIEWNRDGQENSQDRLWNQADISEDGKTLVLKAQADVHNITQSFTLKDNIVWVTMQDMIDSSEPVDISALMNHFYFVPDGRSMGYALPMDFAWVPGLHRRSTDVVGDHFFRSPAAIVVSRGVYAALVPDIDSLAHEDYIPYALDLRSWEHPGAGVYGLPRLSYGVCPWRVNTHFYTEKTGSVQITKKKIDFNYAIFLGASDNGEQEVMREVNDYLWKNYGHEYFQDIRPQVMPFEKYAQKYGYIYEIDFFRKEIEVDGKMACGFDNPDRRGSNFHAWENDLNIGYGIWYYGNKWGDDKVKSVGEGIMRLSLSAPMKQGAFPCVYNFNKNQWEGSLFWTSWPAHPFDGYDTQSMSVSTWWRIYWYENFERLNKKFPKLLSSIKKHAEFLKNAQLSSGAIPTYYDAALNPDSQLKESATTAIGGAVLAKVARMTGDRKLKNAAIAAGRFMEDRILTKMLFQDFEVFYSCSPKPVYWVDVLNGIPPINNLAIQWSADHFLELYKLTNDKHWLDQGEYVRRQPRSRRMPGNANNKNNFCFFVFMVLNSQIQHLI